ncbi:TonB-dependent receptor [Sphingosinicella sp. LHD-64]|uniref:TonB-dependent receptor domain-containing protein n=1 Tax=Sphingosinicella sp. LHD-64 TaxID=3072139 RepID=UPI00280C6E9E|nr:TonB-dependent receptor [Sphingosinicella sp. LHD-64]MDQ8754953.1 TonB-dependent receptor [Sphingosinicella sp. LHD-64]
MRTLAHRFHLDSTVAAIAVASAALMAAAPAYAQDTLPPGADEGEGEAIIITGSRIRRDPLDQDQPVVFVDRSDIDRTGLTSAADVLQRLPGSGGALNSRFNNSGNFGNPPDGGGVGAGAAEADLRYLGSKRVLVLVDGLRFVNGASASGVPGSTDLNSIPESMIERIEVLQAGASAIYGSDAIAGVVNIITRQQQDGLQASAQLGIFNEGDGFTQNYQMSYGLGGNDDRTRIVIGGNYIRQDEIRSGNRDISLFPTPGATSCAAGGCSSGTPLGRFIVGPDDLTLIAPVIGRAPTLADYRPWAGGADAFNFAPYNFIQIPLERYGGFVSLTHELTDTITVRLRGIYNRRNSRNQAAPLPLFIGPDAGNGNLLDTIVIDASNPFNPFGTLDATTYDLIARRVVEGGPRRYEQSVDTYYVAGTVDGSFDLFGNNWYWDVNGTWGRNDAKQTVFGNVNAANVQRALGPIANCTAPCVPLNIFGGEGSITPEMLDYISFTQRDSSRQELWDVSVNVSGGLFELPGGTAALAIGYEHRDQSGRFDPDPTVAAGLGSDIPALPTRGSYNVDEAYAELRLPLLGDRPFFHRLEVTGAARWSNYSTSGSTTTFSAGVNWEPVRDLLIRGNWSEGFRAPSIGELFGTPSRFDQETPDPCSAGQTLPNTFSTSAAVRANCIAVGVPADGSYIQNNPQLPVVTGGNQDLDAETSESWGVGAVWRPSFLPRLTLEANYFNIRVAGAIQAIDAEVLLGRCANTLDEFSCDAITRSGSGQITQIRGFLQNIASIETDGIDFTVSYRTGETGAGVFGLTWNNSVLFNYTVTVPATDGVTEIEREGTEQGSPDQAFPRYKSTGILDWSLGELGASLTGRYISGVDEADGNRMGSRFYTDIQLRWNLESGFGFAIGANNLFNVDPPGCFTCGLNNLDPTTYDVPGTFFYARATVRM